MEYQVQYSKRKTISISVKDEAVIVKAPIGMGKKQIDAVITKHQKWIEKAIERCRNKKKLECNLDDEKIKELKLQAKAYFDIKTREFSKIMNIKYGRVTITSARTRFGSCSSKANISYSFRLMLYPEAAREYVVVHELAHIKEMNHSERFYNIVRTYMPDYKERKKLLKA